MNEPVIGSQKRRTSTGIVLGWLGVAFLVLVVAASLDAATDLPTTRSSNAVMIGRDTPAGAMNVFMHALAVGDSATLADSYYLPEDVDGSVRRGNAQFDLKQMELYRTIAARFGPDVAATMVHWPGIPPRGYFPDDFYIETESPHMASERNPRGDNRLPSMRRSDDGIWRMGGRYPVSKNHLDEMRNNEKVLDRLDAIIVGIKAGKYATVGDLDYEMSGRKAGDEYDEMLVRKYQEEMKLQAAAKLGPGTVGGAIGLYVQAGTENDIAGMAKFFYAEGDRDGKLAAAHAERVMLVNGFCQAMNYKLGNGEQMMRSFGLVSMSYTPGEIGKVVERGDSATGMLPGHDILKFRRVKGVWKVDVTPDPPSDTGQQLDGMTRDNRSIDQVTKDVVSGKYTKVGQVRDALVAAKLAATPDENFKDTNYKLQGE